MTTLRPHLFLAALLIAVSWTPFGSEWRFLLVEPPPSGPDVFIAPHVHAMVWLVDVWRSLIEALSGADVIDRSLATELARDGLPMWLLLQGLALVLLLTGFFRAGRLSVPSPASEDPVRSDPRLDDTTADANGVQSLSAGPSSHLSRFGDADAFRHQAALDQELTEISHRLGNLLLNPDAHAVAEPIADLGRRVRQMQTRLPVREMQSMSEKRSADAE